MSISTGVTALTKNKRSSKNNSMKIIGSSYLKPKNI